MGDGSMDDEAAAVEAIRGEMRRGAYARGGAWADGLSGTLRERPAVALERARLRMRQGRMVLARAALAEARTEGAREVERVLLELEGACLHVFQHADLTRALGEADAALARAGGLDTVDTAEVQRVHARIQLMAAAHHALPPAAAQDARARMAASAGVLERAGREDEAMASFLTLAGLAAGRERLRLLEEVSERAARAGVPHLAAEARVNQAEHRIHLGDADEAVHADLDAAEALYAAADHVFGAIDARRVRARLALERQGGGTGALEACLREYLDADLPRAVLSLLLELSQRAHERGDPPRADTLRRQALVLAEEAGLGLIRHTFVLSQAELLTRASDYGGAIDLCEQALARGLSSFFAASVEQLLVTAYSLVGDQDASLRYARSAMQRYDELEVEDSASLAAVQVALALASRPGEAALDEAEQLLRERMARDRRRGDLAAAIAKREALFSLFLQRFHQSPAPGRDARWLAAAARELARGQALARRLSGTERARRMANLLQQRGRLCQSCGDEAGMERAWQEAAAVYEGAALAMEAANCRFLLGVHCLNLANQDLAAWFFAADESLRSALGYYAGAGMRTQAADARYMLAKLYANAAVRVAAPAAAELVEHALGELAAAEADYDAIRREYSPGGALEAQPGKQTLAGNSRRIYDLAVQLLLFHRHDADEAWRWTQRAKARALTDALGAGSGGPGRVLAALEAHPASLRLARDERNLAARVQQAPAEERPALRESLKRLHADPRLREYRELRSGAALEPGDLAPMVADERGPATVFVDWMVAGSRLVLLARRAGGPAQTAVLPVGPGDVGGFVDANLAPHSFRDTLGENPEILDELEGLIQPLESLAAPGERLVLCPTGALHAVPLHALKLGGEPLLARNPVVYTPSLTVLRHCLVRRSRAGGVRTAALLGNPGGDRGEAGELVRDLGRRFGATPLLEGEVTFAAFAGAAAKADLVHFQGHARHDRGDPLASYLELADGVMTARDVFGLPRLRAELVVLAACESAANVVRTGDELLGMIPAFLYAGAQSVLATLWRVSGPSAALVMRHFYDALADGAADRAEALRRAMLAVRAVPGREAPYHWAPFVLHGAWD
jgi:hypothetical protein